MAEDKYNELIGKYSDFAMDIGEEFCHWLEKMGTKYNCDENDIQDIVKQFLM